MGGAVVERARLAVADSGRGGGAARTLYSLVMRSKVAEEIRRAQIDDVLRLSADQRVTLAFELGERDLEFYIALHNIDRQTAIRTIRREHQLGRRYSRCMNESPP